MQEDGEAQYRRLQEFSLTHTVYSGARRLAKLLTVARHDENMSPAVQYPIGGGGQQWRIRDGVEVNFLVACFVDPNMVAHTPGFEVNLVEPHGSRRLENRTKLRIYLETA